MEPIIGQTRPWELSCHRSINLPNFSNLPKMAFFSLSMMAETGIIFGIVFAFFGLIAISTFLIAKRLSPKKSRKNIIFDEFPTIEEVTISSETVRGLRFQEGQREKKIRKTSNENNFQNEPIKDISRQTIPTKISVPSISFEISRTL